MLTSMIYNYHSIHSLRFLFNSILLNVSGSLRFLFNSTTVCLFTLLSSYMSFERLEICLQVLHFCPKLPVFLRFLVQNSIYITIPVSVHGVWLAPRRMKTIPFQLVCLPQIYIYIFVCLLQIYFYAHAYKFLYIVNHW